MSPAFDRYFRAANFLAGAQIYLQDNVLLRQPLEAAHVKDRLLGHWGTCPGINLVHTHLNRLIVRDALDVMLVTGGGHGAPANLANLYLEGTLRDFYPHLTHDEKGLHEFVRSFSWPGGFPSHLYPGVPGTIHEGGELGYALATAFGAAFDNPGLIVACIVGDGESETGPTAAAWHSPKFLDPAESGAVLPILHVNGYKISNPSIPGTMSDEELTALFTGYGWQPCIVEGEENLGPRFGEALDRAVAEIHRIQHEARADKRTAAPAHWPLIILRSPKGWTGVKELDGEPVEGSFRSHQVPVADVKKNPDHLRLVENWLRSYRPQELFDGRGAPHPDILQCCPQGPRRMGSNPHTFGGKVRQPLQLPALNQLPAGTAGRGKTLESPMQAVARYLAEVIARNPQTFRIFSPDELLSNKLGAVFDAPTERDYQWPVEGGDRATHLSRHGGRVLEILSEHTCQGWLQGYLLTGRHGLFPSYESFLPIITSMMDQFAKFLKMSGGFEWRLPVPSLNYLETSTLWRQEHNGFSHQSPGLINSLLNKKKDVMRVYLPPDASCALSTLDHCLGGTNHVNLVIADKQPMPVWLSMEEAVAHCRAGAGIWRWASTDDGVDPDVVLVGIGDIPMMEVMAAAQLLRQDAPCMRVRVVNVTDLLILARNSEHPHGLDAQLFSALFTPDRPVIVNFHGYPSAVEQLLFGRGVDSRFIVNGYQEEGTTTTPFDMLVRNGTSRYHLVVQALREASAFNPRVAVLAGERALHYQYLLREFARQIEETGKDPEEITEWRWTS